MIAYDSNPVDTTIQGFSPHGNMHMLRVDVPMSDIISVANGIIAAIADKTWISRMGNDISRMSYETKTAQTIEHITNIANQQIANPTKIEKEFGEYLISTIAQKALENKHYHTIVPLSELWKEQRTGNPGFDFHTVSQNTIIVFGEAKFGSAGNMYLTAIPQIARFFEQKKDTMDLRDLMDIVGEIPARKVAEGHKGFTAAFSVVARNFDSIKNNIISKIYEHNLDIYEEIYLIAIKIV